LVRRANLPAAAPGREAAVHQTGGGAKVAVISLLGRMFMKAPCNCPFAAVDRVLEALPADVRIIAVDVHAEATSEKVAMGWHLDGRVSVVFGTHTHIPTADERILPKGTAYITDVGMTGPYDSVLGRMKERVLSSMRSGVPSVFDVAEGDPRLCGIVVSVEPSTGRATHIERIRIDAVQAGAKKPVSSMGFH
jgi:metallophosphoesterase (TIGR00282 family)